MTKKVFRMCENEGFHSPHGWYTIYPDGQPEGYREGRNYYCPGLQLC